MSIKPPSDWRQFLGYGLRIWLVTERDGRYVPRVNQNHWCIAEYRRRPRYTILGPSSVASPFCACVSERMERHELVQVAKTTSRPGMAYLQRGLSLQHNVRRVLIVRDAHKAVLAADTRALLPEVRYTGVFPIL